MSEAWAYFHGSIASVQISTLIEADAEGRLNRKRRCVP
jgi:hypothetical protein